MFKLQSISSKLLLESILIVGISLSILNLIWINYLVPKGREDLANLQLATAYRAADKIDAYISSRQQYIHDVVTIEDILNLTPERQTEIFNLMLKNDSSFEEIDFIGPDGKDRIKTSRFHYYKPEEYTDKSGSDIFTKAAEGESYVGPVYFENAVPYLVMSIPIYDNKQDFAGVVTTELNLTNLWSTIQEIKPSEKGFAYVVGPEGVLIAHPDFSEVLKNENLSEIFCVQKVLGKREACIRDSYVNEKGMNVYAVGVPIESLGWGIIVESPVSEATTPINRILAFSLITMGLTLFWAVAIGIWFSQRITSPIKQLERGAQVIGQGNLNFRLNIKTADEIEEVAKSFNHMSQQLDDLYHHLELKVAQRTKDLQIRTEEANAERNKLAIILEGISDGVFALDLNRRFILFNKGAEMITGYKASEVLGKSFDDVLQLSYEKFPIRALDIAPFLPQINEDRVIFNKQDLKLISKEGKEVFVNIISALIKEGSHTNLSCIATIHDVSGEHELEAMKLDFVSMAAHELRTPLTAIRGYLSVFISENATKLNEQQITFLNRVNISTQQLVALVENLLNVSRIERGVFTINLEPVDWLATTKQILGDFTDRAKEKQLQIILVEPEQPLPQIQADKLRLGEVLSNLLANAISYTPLGGTIKVWLEAKDNALITHVADSGVGIPKEALPHLFTKFFRVSGKLEQGSKGTGLGLYISKAIIDMHHGQIWVESELGKGSIFSFAIPISSYKTPEASAKESGVMPQNLKPYL